MGICKTINSNRNSKLVQFQFLNETKIPLNIRIRTEIEFDFVVSILPFITLDVEWNGRRLKRENGFKQTLQEFELK